MSRATLQDAIDFGLPNAIGACGADTRFLRMLNESIQLLLFKGKWWGTAARFRFCVTDGEITLPKQIAALEAAMVCGRPARIRDMWYEFLENGFGLRHSGTGRCWGFNECIDRGSYPTFSNVVGTDKNMLAVCDRITDVGKPVLFLGYDQNNNWIRTTQNGVVSDGEVVSFAQAPGTHTQNLFSAVTDIQPANNLDGQWWLYEFSVTNLSQRLIGHYEYYDTRPSFRRYLLPGIFNQTNPDGSCNYTSVEVAAKLEFIKVKVPTDYLIIGNLPALKQMIMGVNNAENEPNGTQKVAIINAATESARLVLDAELDHYLGSGRKMGMNVDYYGAEAEPVQNFL